MALVYVDTVARQSIAQQQNCATLAFHRNRVIFELGPSSSSEKGSN
jgi:hypothetical protein